MKFQNDKIKFGKKKLYTCTKMLNVQHFTVTFNTKKVQFSSITEEVFNLDARYIIQNVMV